MHIIQDHALTLVESYFEVPLLPRNRVTLLAELGNFKRSAFRLNNIQWLNVCSKILSFWYILIGWLHLVRSRFLDGRIRASWKKVNTGNLHCRGTDDWGNADW